MGVIPYRNGQSGTPVPTIYKKSDTVSLFFVIFAILVSHLYSSLAERDRGGGKKCEGGSSAYLRTAETPLTIRNHIKKSAQFVRFSTIFD